MEVPGLFCWRPADYRKNGVNFGDELGPIVAKDLLERRFGDQHVISTSGRLLSVGSVLHFAKSGDAVWGTGLRHDFCPQWRPGSLTIRAVRGPITRNFLERNNVQCPEIYGDPAILLKKTRPSLFNENVAAEGTCIVPNLRQHDALRQKYGKIYDVINPRRENAVDVINDMKKYDIIISSSLHGIIVGELLGKQTFWLNEVPLSEGTLKFEDYFAGTGRDDVQYCASISEVLKSQPICPIPSFDELTETLETAFPFEMFSVVQESKET